MRIRIAAVTHRGHVRTHNEDALGWGGWALQGDSPTALTTEIDVTSPITIVVCDGLGGHAGGAAASRFACEGLSAPGAIADSTGDDHVRTVVGRLLQQISDSINDLGEQRPELHAMGCTVVGVTVLPDSSAVVFNVGDSRAYRLEGAYLAQLSLDHRASGSNLLRQALGAGRRVVVEPDYFDCRLQPGPGILLCTDGLDDYADFESIERLMLSAPADLPVLLRDLALAGGGGDNVTVVQVSCVPDKEGIDHG
ncbi:PP2C family protein-serine/threonine phosphatase [Nocardia sp. NPDC004722]